MKGEDTSECMSIDSILANKIGVFNAIGLILAIASPMIIDPLLTTHVWFPTSRNYSPWTWVAALFSVPVFWFTRRMLVNQRPHWGNYLRAFFPLFIPGIVIALVAFRPEVPHLGVMLLTLAYGSLSMFTVASRQGRERYDYLTDPKVGFQARLERLRATVSNWQMISVYGLAAYIGFVAVILSVLWTIAGYMVTANKERFSLGASYLAQVAIYSICVAVGPFYESFQMMFKSNRKLSSISNNPQSDATG